MKIKLFLLLFLSVISTYAQLKIEKDSLLKREVATLVEEMEFMYAYDQTMREYIIFKTFDKSETNRIENLSDSLRSKEMEHRKFVSDSMGDHIYRNYINPMDSQHTERMIEIIKTYGFPTNDRIRRYYEKDWKDPEFNPVILLVHAPKPYWEELKTLIKTELAEDRITRCEYGYMLWQLTGRKSFQPMLDNGYLLIEKEGRTVLESTCG